MIRVRFIKSCATSSTSYGKNAVAWLDERTATSFISAGLCVEFMSEPADEKRPSVIVQEVKAIATVQEIKPKRKRKK